MRALGILATVLALAACGSDGATEEPPPLDDDGEGACLPPNRLVSERCLEPGVQDDGCPAGTVGQPDGTCLPAGVPPELCAEGFTHDGDAGCEPILPAEPCAEGLMALPGETACRPVMDCGSAPWGNLEVDATTLYVDASFGGVSTGTAAAPFTTIGEALAAAPSGGSIAVAEGTYTEDLTLDRPVRLWGRCPDLVTLAGTGVEVAAILMVPDADGSEIGGLRVTGPSLVGIGVVGVVDVVFDRLWVHQVEGRGINAQASSMGTALAAFLLRDSLLEDNRDSGILNTGADATIQGVVVRDTDVLPGELAWGQGMSFEVHPTSGLPSHAVIERAVVERNRRAGISVIGSTATLDAVVVRDNLPNADDGKGGNGLEIVRNNPTDQAASVVIGRSLLERNRGASIGASGSELAVRGVVVRDTLPEEALPVGGVGIALQLEPNALTPTVATIESVLLERNHTAALSNIGSVATIIGPVARDTFAQPVDALFGRGIAMQHHDPSGVRGAATVIGALVERNRDLGVSLLKTDATLAGLIVRDTLPRESDNLSGRGISIVAPSADPAPTVVNLSGSVITANHGLGVGAFLSAVSLHAVVVSDTVPQLADGVLGDGVTLASGWPGLPSAVSNSLLTNNARGGLVTFGAEIGVVSTSLLCNAIDLVGEPIDTTPFHLEDYGNNRCGCATEQPCKVTTAGLELPTTTTQP